MNDRIETYLQPPYHKKNQWMLKLGSKSEEQDTYIFQRVHKLFIIREIVASKWRILTVTS